MTTNNSEYEALCQALERVAGFKVSTPNDFERLSEKIFEWHHVTVSASTLKRLWGYAQQSAKPHRSTLDVLARFVGYKDYASFSQGSGAECTQSKVFLADALTTDTLEKGARLHLSWPPDRVCIVEHQGDGRFLVVKAENAKIHEGDVFECHLFINHEPLYMDLLQQGARTSVCYVAGQTDGVTIRRL